MAEAKKKTLLDTVKPLITSVNLLYGLNLGHRKSAGCVQRLHKQLHKHWVWIFFFINFYSYCNDKYEEAGSGIKRRYVLLTTLVCCFIRLFAFNEPETQRLVRRLKEHETGNMSAKASARITRVFLLTLALIAFTLTKIVLKILRDFVDGYIHQARISDSEAMDFLFGGSLLCLLILMFFLFLMTILVFPILLSCLCCVLVIYCPSRLDDHVENIRRARSPLRRARLLSRLCHAYYRLQPLASMTNRNMAITMSMLKLLTMLLWVICCNVLEEKKIENFFNIPVLQYSIPLLTYLRVAPSANNMHLKIFEAGAETVMVDDQWQSRDPISRSLLIKLRLNLLQHLVHIRMDKGPFTLLGDSVDPETLFTIFVEANDLRTTLQ